MRTEPDKGEHDRMVRSWAEELKRDGYEVKADIEGCEQPPVIHGHRPDIEARKPYKTIIGETETCESIGWTDTRDQFVAFTKGRNTNTEFHAQAPKECVQDLRDQVASWKQQGYNIIVDDYWPYG